MDDFWYNVKWFWEDFIKFVNGVFGLILGLIKYVLQVSLGSILLAFPMALLGSGVAVLLGIFVSYWGLYEASFYILICLDVLFQVWKILS